MTNFFDHLFKYWLMALGLIFIGACNYDDHSSSIVGNKKHFDLKGYFEGEVQRLGMKGSAKKMVVAEGKEESKIMDSVDFQRELGIFSTSDINRPAWSDKYVSDSSFNEKNQLVHLNIKSLDKGLRTQNIGIDFLNGVVSKVEIQNNTFSSIASSNQVLTYEPAIGYSIVSNQKVSFSEAQDFRIQVRFLK